METSKEKVSYCIGLETGKNLKQQFVDMDGEKVIAGFKDAVLEAEPQLKQEEVQKVLTTLSEQIEEQRKQFIAHLATENKKEGEDFLAENKKKEGVITLTSGLQYKVLSSGNGPSPTIFDVVSTHYRGTFINGREFDSSYARGKPNSFPVNRVIPAWTEALQKMKVGDKWQLFVPSYLAYGEGGFGNQIGPNTTLIFEMELLGIENP